MGLFLLMTCTYGILFISKTLSMWLQWLLCSGVTPLWHSCARADCGPCPVPSCRPLTHTNGYPFKCHWNLLRNRKENMCNCLVFMFGSAAADNGPPCSTRGSSLWDNRWGGWTQAGVAVILLETGKWHQRLWWALAPQGGCLVVLAAGWAASPKNRIRRWAKRPETWPATIT